MSLQAMKPGNDSGRSSYDFLTGRLLRNFVFQLAIGSACFYCGIIVGTHNAFCDCSQCVRIDDAPSRGLQDKFTRLNEFEKKGRLDNTDSERITSRFPGSVGDFMMGVSFFAVLLP